MKTKNNLKAKIILTLLVAALCLTSLAVGTQGAYAKVKGRNYDATKTIKITSTGAWYQSKSAKNAYVYINWRCPKADGTSQKSLHSGDYVQHRLKIGNRTWSYNQRISTAGRMHYKYSGSYDIKVARSNSNYKCKVSSRTAVWNSSKRKWVYGSWTGWKTVKIKKIGK